jgi:uncharacterized membrane protein HdeD (DUF308 family)
MLLVRGVAGILFGLAAFAWPGLTLAVLITLWGIYAIVDGIVGIASAVRHRREIESWWAMLLGGAASLIAGIVAWIMPAVTAIALVVIIGFWAIARGVFVTMTAVRLRDELQDEWLLILSGALSVALGLVFVVSPGAGALAMVWLIGTLAIVSGALFVGLAFRVRPHRRHSGIPPYGAPV